MSSDSSDDDDIPGLQSVSGSEVKLAGFGRGEESSSRIHGVFFSSLDKIGSVFDVLFRCV